MREGAREREGEFIIKYALNVYISIKQEICLACKNTKNNKNERSKRKPFFNYCREFLMLLFEVKNCCRAT